MTNDLNIAIAQLNPTVGDLVGNAEKIRKAWQSTDADLMIFTEMVLSGYPLEDLVFKTAFLDATEDHIKDLIEFSKSQDTTALITTPLRVPDAGEKTHADIAHDEQVHNAALLIHKGEIIAQIYKHRLANYGVFDEKRTFVPGPMPMPVEFKGTKLGIMICEDLWHEDVVLEMKNQGAEILICPNGSPYSIGKQSMRYDHLGSMVKKTGLPLVYTNQVGGQDDLVFDGGSFAMDANGSVITRCAFFEEDICTIHPGATIEQPDDMALTYEALKLGLHDYITKNNFPGVLLGLSGGIDSALTAVIAVDALGADKVHAVMMPSPFTSQDSLDDAEELAKNLGITLDTIAISDAMTAFETNIPNLEGVSHENMQSRTRGLILMALSNSTGHMVLSTGNKSEMAVGYATLYGDMNGGFNALKDLYKTQVYELSRWRNEQGAVIPERIITKAPTAELKDNQIDQDSLPPYEDLDVILHNAIELEKSAEEITALGYDAAIVQKTLTMLDRAEYKRRQACPGVKITTRAFGRDRRYPMTNKFQQF